MYDKLSFSWFGFQKKAKSEGLWNLAFTRTSPGSQYGAGLSNVEYTYMCEEMGRCSYAPEVTIVIWGFKYD